MPARVLTIGHSSHSADDFIGLLRKHGVSVVADVRSVPFSRFSPQFNKDTLSKTLEKAGIGYVFFGRELGARSQDQSCYVDGQVRYSLLARTELFRAGLERLFSDAKDKQVAIMCTEKDPLDCHRTLLIARSLVAADVEVNHVLADGVTESNDEAMVRLLTKHGLQQPDLFRSTEELLEDALQRQERRIAYVDRDLVGSAVTEGST